MMTYSSFLQSAKRAGPSAERKLFRTLNRGVLPVVRAGFGSPLPIGGGVVVLETEGRISGKAREVPLVAFRSGSQVTVSTIRDESNWLSNLEATPEAFVWMNGKRHDVTGSVKRGRINTASLAIKR